MSDFSLPVVTTGYIATLQDLKDRDVDSITLCLVDPSNIPVGAIKYNRISDKLQEWSGTAWVDKIISLAGGGTSSSTAAGARANLGLGSMSLQDSNAVAITAGNIRANLNALDLVAGLVAQARLGAGSTGAGTNFLADDQTYKLIASVPSGSGFIWYTNAAPTGYLLCDGSPVSRATYAILFGLLGITFGPGDGATTFNLPDLRQRFPLGKAPAGTGNTLGATGGAIDHTHNDSAHSHSIAGQTIVQGSPIVAQSLGLDNIGSRLGFFDGVSFFVPNVGSIAATMSGSSYGFAAYNTGNNAPAAGSSNNPPYLVVNFIIKT